MSRRRDVAPEPWEQQPGESAKAYAAFCLYRDLPPAKRSLRAVTELIYGPKPGMKRSQRNVPGKIRDWAARWRWAERAKAWDEEQDRQNREAQLQAIKEMRERHAEQAKYLQAKALEALQKMVPQEFSPADALRYLIEGAKLERISRGEPETIQETRSTWTDAVLAAWERRMQQAQAQEQPQEPGEGTPAEPAGEADAS